MGFKFEIIVTTCFAALHRWPDAPESVRHLANTHRHVFHVRLGVPVKHGDRQVEFLTAKADLIAIVREHIPNESTLSCEQMAVRILLQMPYAVWCEVWEDNENGARVERD